jgi:hypothetical protein
MNLFQSGVGPEVTAAMTGGGHWSPGHIEKGSRKTLIAHV